MKRVGIMTYHRAKNYGAMIQSYALISFLKKKYPSVRFEIIDYQASAERRYYLKSIIRNALKCGLGAARDELVRNRRMKRFAKSLPLSKMSITTDSAAKLFSRIRNKYDLIIVGSDAIFNWRTRVFPTAYFLGEQLGAMKASYAASAHGMKYLGESPERIEYCRTALADFDYIGVRDAHTEAFVRHCLPEARPEHNCDPSLLLDMENIDYGAAKRKLERAGINPERPIIAVMTADPRIVEPIYERYKGECQFVSLYLRNPLIRTHLVDLTPLEWVGVFKYASLTVTEYFHGTLLSLKNGTPTVAVDRSDFTKGSEGKIRDVVFNRMGLRDMYYNYSEVRDGTYAARALELAERAMSTPMDGRILAAVTAEAENVAPFVRFMDSFVEDEN
ncbi:MAG: polysaccharide pyruvyl transferase family protein [Clostridia bacterium]|nr:polysaccharide pyruvyl transferase family protein [Clostridia bacterium]